MKQIKMSELKPGDIFCYEIILHGREAFQVIEKIKNKTNNKYRLKCKSRKTSIECMKEIAGHVIHLRTI